MTSLGIASLLLAASLGTGGCAGSPAAVKPNNASNPPGQAPSPTAPGDSGSGSEVASIAITPNAASATVGSSLQLAATITGTTTDKSVKWTAVNGQINSSGMYTAPTAPGTDTITATSMADVTKTVSIKVTVTAQTASDQALAAFPGAEGGGAAAVGGRGGKVFEVTNLKDSGNGSLRECVHASGPRHCIFRVAGLIPVTSDDLKVSNPYLSIDGQTAPGQIILGGPNTKGQVLRISTHDVVVRYVTVSPDNIEIPSGPDDGTVGLSTTNCDCYNIIMDHVSTRWAGNKMLAGVSNYVAANHNISFQWSMLYEPHAGHPVGPGMAGNPIGCPSAAPDADLPNPCFESKETQVDYHHSLFANIDHRIPENANMSSAFNSNIVYNWSWYANEWIGASTIDVVDNLFKPGNLNAGAQTYPIHFSGNLSSELPNGTPSDFVSGNICRGDTAPASDQWGHCAYQISGENGSEIGPVPTSWRRSKPDPRAFPITADAANTLEELLLPIVGNSQHLDCTGNWVSHRDAADNRVINQYKTGGKGGFWPNAMTEAGATSIPAPSSDYQDHPMTSGFTACTESMHDGIPDQWKTKKGLSTTDPDVHKAKAANGYTWLENYLNGQ